jgi:ATP-binding cassette subfamily B (MDR/TAP) protein 1
MAFKYATPFDKVLFSIGLIASMLFGCALPAFSLMFGHMIDSVGGNSFSMLSEQAKYMIYIGIGVYFISFLMLSTMSVFSERISFKIKVDYFKQCLAKNAGWLDEKNPNELAPKISKETTAI